MTPTGRDIARYLSFLNRTRRRYKQARIQEFEAEPRNRILQVPDNWHSSHSRVMAFTIACEALGGRTNWGNL